MLSRILGVRIAVAAVAIAAVGMAFGQDDAPKASFSRLLNTDVLIDNHVRFLGRRYNLSEDQEAYTLALLHEKTDAFMQRHRDELYDLIDRLVEVRAGAEIDVQELGRWGRRAQPLYDEAKLLIVDGNNQWRDILTEDQKRIHDGDLREMYDSFATTESQLERIVGGQMTLDEFRRGPGQAANSLRGVQRTPMPPMAKEPGSPSPNTPAPRTPAGVAPAPTTPSSPGNPPPAAAKQPGAGSTAAGPAPSKSDKSGSSGAEKAPPPPSGRPALPGRDEPAKSRTENPRGRASKAGGAAPGNTDFESQWEQYVREFIAKFQLDDAQSQRAWSILKDCQEAARRVVDKRKPEIERLDKKLLSLNENKENSADKLKELADINRQRTKLMEPVGEIFEKQLKPRLEKLPTRAQRAAADENAKKPAKPGKPDAAGQRSPRQPAPPPPPQPQPEPPPPQPEQSGSAEEAPPQQ